MTQPNRRRRSKRLVVRIQKNLGAETPVRGVPLKVVSLFTMAFAILCLASFLAGRTNFPTKASSGPVAGNAAFSEAAAHPPVMRVRE
jgi:hypothetical protein